MFADSLRLDVQPRGEHVESAVMRFVYVCRQFKTRMFSYVADTYRRISCDAFCLCLQTVQDPDVQPRGGHVESAEWPARLPGYADQRGQALPSRYASCSLNYFSFRQLNVYNS